MGVNRYKPHILILPEDDANRQIANGFSLGIASNQIQILPEAGGWVRVQETFKENYSRSLFDYEQRFIVLMIDLDDQIDRIDRVREIIDERLRDRVYILGARTEPEALRQAQLGTYETIGLGLAEDCRCRTRNILGHELLRHNEAEMSRLRASVCSKLP